jgi:hypothetical protein
MSNKRKNRRRNDSQGCNEPLVWVVTSNEAERVIDRIFDYARSNDTGVLGVPGSATESFRAAFPSFITETAMQEPDFQKGGTVFLGDIADPENPNLIIVTRLVGMADGHRWCGFIDVADSSSFQSEAGDD